MAGKRHVLIGNHPPLRREDQHIGLHVNSFSIGYRGGSIWIEHLDAMDEASGSGSPFPWKNGRSDYADRWNYRG